MLSLSTDVRNQELMGNTYERLYNDVFVVVKCGQAEGHEMNVPESGSIEDLYIHDADR